MKNFFKKRSVAIGLTALVVLGCLVYGWSYRQTAVTAPIPEPQAHTGSAGVSTSWVDDAAGVLSAYTISRLDSYNAAWDAKYGSVVAVASVNGTGSRSIEDYAASYGRSAGLGQNDMLLLMDISGEDWYFVVSDSEIIPDAYVEDAVYSFFVNAYSDGDYRGAVEDLFRQLDSVYTRFAAASASASGEMQIASPRSFSIVGILILVLIAFWFLSAIDRARYRSWYGRYNGVAGAPAFVPLVFWHRLGTAWAWRMGASFGASQAARAASRFYSNTNRNANRNANYNRGSSAFRSGNFGSRSGFGSGRGGSSFGSRGGFGSGFGGRGGFGGRR